MGMKWLIGVMLGSSLVTAAAAEANEKSCRNLYRLSDLNYAVEPGRLIPANGKVPEHCRVRAVVNRAIQVEVRMPLDWNGRFMFSTVGGSAGRIGDTSSLLGRGFAMASTDTGHEEQDEYLLQPEAVLDFAYRGVHLATGFAKATIRSYYGRDIDYAYLKGCSNGGRAAMLEAIRFPDDYDGIIAGAPAFRFQEFMPWMTEVARYQERHPLTKEALDVLDAVSVAACDDLDGVRDGVINDPRLCTDDVFDVESTACGVGQTEGCLTSGQIETARFIYSDQLDSMGNVVSPGVLPGAEAAGDWAMWMLPNSLFGDGENSLISTMGLSIETFLRKQPDFAIADFHTADDRELLEDMGSYMDVRTADLTEFREHGGKLLMYQGWNDWPLRPQRAIDYLEEAEALNGGPEETSEFFRLFMVPGMIHCATGPGAWMADYVDPLVDWRENGEAPDRLIATHPAAKDGSTKGFTRPLCVYPELARYKGRGDASEAGSFECR